ncbi:MAG: hypothetical protein A6F71_07415 [Cycloclasticus sp. symbiont of Poecilosclerida sp. M]|nr:MAG: hypothetical protein A6F71_07415 [Cycloclasticus sp. symbiont of Poecilosclerida sp. M]
MKALLLMLVMCGVVACSGDDSASTSNVEQKQETVFDGHLNALEKTREIENVLQQGADRRQQKLEEQY